MGYYTKIDLFICEKLPTGILKEYYCRINRKLAKYGLFANEAIRKTKDNFFMHVNKTDGVSWRIYYTGTHEPVIGLIIKKSLKSGDVFIDVGANIGYFSIMAANVVGENGKVISFEASPYICGLMEKNISLNSIKNIELRNVAVSKEVGIVNIYSQGKALLAQTSIFQSRGGKLQAKVPCAPLTAEVLGINPARIRLIKIDVEGAEELVIKGIQSLIDHPEFNADFLLEVSPTEISCTPEELLQVFTSKGYKIFEIPNDYKMRSYFLPSMSTKLNQIMPDQINKLTDILLSRRETAPIL